MVWQGGCGRNGATNTTANGAGDNVAGMRRIYVVAGCGGRCGGDVVAGMLRRGWCHIDATVTTGMVPGMVWQEWCGGERAGRKAHMISDVFVPTIFKVILPMHIKLYYSDPNTSQ